MGRVERRDNWPHKGNNNVYEIAVHRTTVLFSATYRKDATINVEKHVLYHLLPDCKTELKYELRPRRNDLQRVKNFDTCYAITQLIYKDCYWHYTIVA